MSDVYYITQLIDLVNKSGVIGMLIIFIVLFAFALHRGWLYTGRYVTARDASWQLRFDDLRADRDAIKTERESWKMLAMSRGDISQRAMLLAESEIVKGDVPS